MSVQVMRTTLTGSKNFSIALAKVFGIGRPTALAISEACGISKELRVVDVKEAYIQKVEQYIQDNYMTGDQLKRKVRGNILQLIAMKSYRGSRHELGLSISGDTHSNSKTARKLNHVHMYDTSR